MTRNAITAILPFYIEFILSKFPGSFFIISSILSIFISLLLRITGKKKDSIFVGLWAPTFLLFGLYRKLIKLSVI